MTLSDLNKWRKFAPFFVFGFAIIPWLLLRSKNFEQAKFVNELLVPAIGALFTFFYVALDFRGPIWKRELEKNINPQIRQQVLSVIPRDLEVTEGELHALRGEVIKKLVGVFWEAVDRSEILRSQKEHFYSNGIVYTTSIDVFLICLFVGLLYEVAAYSRSMIDLFWIGLFFIVIAFISRYVALPMIRARHQELSRNQLELLCREQREFISTRFREILSKWRAERLLS